MTAPPTPGHLFVVLLVAVYSAAQVDGQVPTPESSPAASTLASDADGAVAPAAPIPRNTVFEILAGAQHCEISGDSCVQTKHTAKGVRQHTSASFRPALSLSPKPAPRVHV